MTEESVWVVGGQNTHLIIWHAVKDDVYVVLYPPVCELIRSDEFKGNCISFYAVTDAKPYLKSSQIWYCSFRNSPDCIHAYVCDYQRDTRGKRRVLPLCLSHSAHISMSKSAGCFRMSGGSIGKMGFEEITFNRYCWMLLDLQFYLQYFVFSNHQICLVFLREIAVQFALHWYKSVSSLWTDRMWFTSISLTIGILCKLAESIWQHTAETCINVLTVYIHCDCSRCT